MGNVEVDAGSKQLEGRFEKSEEVLKAVLDSTTDGILVIDNNRKVILANKQFLQMWNIPEDMYNTRDEHRLLEYVLDQLENPKAFIEKVDKLYKTFDKDFDTLLFKDGRVFERSSCPLLKKGKKAEEALRESEEKYRLLVDLLPVAVVIHSEGNILFINRVGAKLLGAPYPEEFIGKPIMDFIHPDYREIVRERIYKILEERKALPVIEEKLVRLDGTVIDMEVVSVPFIYKGKLADMTVARDITERKRTEELRKKAEENRRLYNQAVEYDKLKTEFFSNISHELKTPLNVIFSTTQLLDLYLKDCLLGNNDTKVNKRINTMRQNCYRLLRLVNNLIDITKIDAGFFQVHLQNYNIVSVVEEITLSVSEYIESKGIALKFDTDIEEKLIACDLDKIERIVLNLLSNAVKFTKPGGSITVNMHDRGESIVISIKDTGIGIQEDKLEIIFERFRQVNKSLARDHEGSGIGLSLVKSLVEMHDGSICAKSEYGRGSEFIIELPVKVLSEEKNILQKENYNQKGHIERINIEFSDIYS